MSKSVVSQDRVREIMGKNFFGTREAMMCFRVDPIRQQLAVLSEVPFSETLLEQAKDTHILIAIFSFSIHQIRSRVDHTLFFHQPWYKNESFVKERGEVSWQLVQKTEVAKSTSKNWQEQQLLLAKDDGVPAAQVMVYTIIGHYLATSERLFEHIYVRTSSVDSNGRRVEIGNFDSRGLDIGYYWDVYRSDYLGISSARKPD